MKIIKKSLHIFFKLQIDPDLANRIAPDFRDKAITQITQSIWDRHFPVWSAILDEINQQNKYYW